MNTLSPHLSSDTVTRTRARGEQSAAPIVDVVVPVYNEQRTLQASVRELHSVLERQFAFPCQITIVDNASTDKTLQVALALGHSLPRVRAVRLERRGRGLALRAAWSCSEADVVAYTDVDLSTDLCALPDLLTPLLEGRCDLAVGSRLVAGAQVTRGVKRETISRCYNAMLRSLLGVSVADAQCGLKAGRREVVQELLDDVENDGWFFDTELLWLAQRRGFIIHEVPIRWVDDPDSRVDILATSYEDLRGIMRLRGSGRDRDHAKRHAGGPHRTLSPRRARRRAPSKRPAMTGLPGWASK